MKEKEMRENQGWEEKYYKKEIIELYQVLNDEEIKTLEKLGITIQKGKIYTEREFDEIYMELAKFDKDETGLYGNEREEKTNKQFEKILNDETHTEREKILINMYYIECAKNEELERAEKDKLSNTRVAVEEYNNIMTRLDEIGKKCMI